MLVLEVQLDRVHDRRLHGVHDVDLLTLVPANDVDLFAIQLVDDVLDPAAADTDAGAHAVDLVVDRLDRDLGPVAGVAGEGLDLDDPLLDLGDLELEEVPEDVRVSAREDDPDALPDLLHLEDEALHALARVVGLARDLLAPGNDPLALAQVHDHVRALVALDRAVHERADLLDVLVEDDVPLRLADLLDHDLLGGEGRDAAEVAQVLDRTLAVERRDVARVAVDLDHDVLVRAELLLRRREKGALDPLEDELLVDRLLTMERVDDPEDVPALHVHHGAHLRVLSWITLKAPAHFDEPSRSR